MPKTFTDNYIKTILGSLTILVDSREQENSHILSFFDSGHIKHVRMGLPTGDYSCMIPARPEYGITEDLFFQDKIVIERKNGLNEISSCLSQQRDRFERELQRAKDAGTKFILLIEDGSYQDIIQHKYNTSLSESSFLASLLAFQNRYDAHIEFVLKKYAGLMVHRHLHYFCREQLKGMLT